MEHGIALPAAEFEEFAQRHALFDNAALIPAELGETQEVGGQVTNGDTLDIRVPEKEAEMAQFPVMPRDGALRYLADPPLSECVDCLA